jgi:hypothetical protein
MRGKIIFILLLLVILVFTVKKMMDYESFIREERKVMMYVEDETKPLFSKSGDEALEDAAKNSDYYFISGNQYFKRLIVKYKDEEKKINWEDFYLKGVNLGMAIPGKFPAEFSLTFADYLDWLKLIGDMNANVIRTYTILPPEFYVALSYYNLHYDDKPLFIIQGVWIEVPEDEDYYNPAFTRDFQKEIINMIDVIHGNAVLKEHRGKASGVYSANVSKYVAGFLLGREWEPTSVFKTNQVNKVSQYCGDFVCMNNGNAMEAWLAEMMDFSVLYETQEYWFQHPVSFVNWLPLDPMFHNSEIIENNKVREYDNDLESIDFTKFNKTNLFVPGIYAAYHVYPYYPDFIYLQDSYRDAANNNKTINSYFRYLEDLKQHTDGMSLVIAEYGLPSSRGNSHFMPSGFHQGGHTETEQAKLSLELTQDIVKSGCAGAIYFEWIDEWFKHNWLVMDFEQPEDDRKNWHNAENPEQNFGIYAMENKTIQLDGDLKDWKKIRFEKNKTDLKTHADATYFYIASTLPGFDFSRNNLYIAIDTYDKDKGDHKLPFTDKTFENGFEFLAEFKARDSAAILVDEPYSVFTDIYNDHIPVYASKKNANGNFVHELLLSNRSRVSLLGEKTDSVIYDRSPLIFGNSTDPKFSNADWYFDSIEKIMEIRLDWHLLNVCDPAKRFVLDDIAGTGNIEYTETKGFNLYVFITDKSNHPEQQFPVESPYFSTWEEWQTPEYSSRLKPIYFTLQDYFKDLSVPGSENRNVVAEKESFQIADYFDNKKGAVSISFDNAGFTQYLYGLPVLNKYSLSATFGIIPEMLDDVSRNYELESDATMKRLSTKEVKEISVRNEIALQPEKTGFNPAGLAALSRKVHAEVNTLHCNGPSYSDAVPEGLLFIRKTSEEKSMATDFRGIKYLVVNSDISTGDLDDILKLQESKWTILVYHHIFDNASEIPAQTEIDKVSNLFIQKSDFEKQIRLLRNSGYWIATEKDVFKYKNEKIVATVQTERFQNMIFLKVACPLDVNVYYQPLTLQYQTKAMIVRLSGSESDGTYSNKDGSFIFNVRPNKEITIEILEQ